MNRQPGPDLQGDRPNPVLVAVVMPAYLAWAVLRATGRFLAAAIARLGRALRLLVRVVADAIAAISRPLARALRRVALAMRPLVAAVGTAVRWLLSALRFVLGLLGSALGWMFGLLARAIRYALRLVAPVAEFVGQVLTTALRATGRGIVSFARLGLQLLLFASAPLRPIWAAFVAVQASLLHVLAAGMSTVARGLILALSALGHALGVAASMLGRAVSAIARLPGRVVRAALEVLGWIVRPLVPPIERLLGEIRRLIRRLWRAAARAFTFAAILVRLLAGVLRPVFGAIDGRARWLGGRIGLALADAVQVARAARIGLTAALIESRKMILRLAGRQSGATATNGPAKVFDTGLIGLPEYGKDTLDGRLSAGGESVASIAATTAAVLFIAAIAVELGPMKGEVASVGAVLVTGFLIGVSARTGGAREAVVGVGIGTALVVALGVLIDLALGHGPATSPIVNWAAVNVVIWLPFMVGRAVGGMTRSAPPTTNGDEFDAAQRLEQLMRP